MVRRYIGASCAALLVVLLPAGGASAQSRQGPFPPNPIDVFEKQPKEPTPPQNQGTQPPARPPAQPVAPLGPTSDVYVQIFGPERGRLPVASKVRLSTLSATAEVTAAPKQKDRALFRMVPVGHFHIRVSAEGYATAELDGIVERANTPLHLEIHMRPEARAGGDEGDLVPPLSNKAASRYAKGIEALRAGKLKEAESHVSNLLESAPGHPNINYLAGMLYYLKQEGGAALFYFAEAAYLNPQWDEASRALASQLYRSGNYPRAFRTFAAMAAGRNDAWDLEWAAASAAFQMRQYTDARDHARRAYQLGRALVPRAQLLLAFAEAASANWDSARAAAQEFLAQDGDSSLAATARELIASAGKDKPAAPAMERATAAFVAADVIEPRLPSRLWAPPDVDDGAPAVAGNAACPMQDVLAATSQRMDRLFHDMGKVGATEEIHQEYLDGLGRAHNLGRYTTNYFGEVVVTKSGDYVLDEYRDASAPSPARDAAPVASRLVSLGPMIFHSGYQLDYAFRCEGLAQWQGRPAWSVYFSQRPDRPVRTHNYLSYGHYYAAPLHGRAWIDQATSELLHLETDLAEPIPDLKLEEEHLVVDYREQEFQKDKARFVLPSEAMLYMHFQGKLYRISHTLSKFVMFHVETNQKLGKPKEDQP